MKMRARAPTSRAAHATACPWLPALAATTPGARSPASSCEMRLYAPLGELAGRLEERPVRLDLLPELGDVLPARRLGQHDRRPPFTLAVEREDRAHLVQHRLRGRMVHLVDRDHVRDLHDSRFQRL